MHVTITTEDIFCEIENLLKNINSADLCTLCLSELLLQWVPKKDWKKGKRGGKFHIFPHVIHKKSLATKKTIVYFKDSYVKSLTSFLSDDCTIIDSFLLFFSIWPKNVKTCHAVLKIASYPARMCWKNFITWEGKLLYFWKWNNTILMT